MKKFLDYDWLREMQFLGNKVQKKGNLVQKRVTNVTFWLANKQRNSLRANQMRHLNGAKFGSAPEQFLAKTAMVSGFLFATAKIAYLTAMIFLHLMLPIIFQWKKNSLTHPVFSFDVRTML